MARRTQNGGALSIRSNQIRTIPPGLLDMESRANSTWPTTWWGHSRGHRPPRAARIPHPVVQPDWPLLAQPAGQPAHLGPAAQRNVPEEQTWVRELLREGPSTSVNPVDASSTTERASGGRRDRRGEFGEDHPGEGPRSSLDGPRGRRPAPMTPSSLDTPKLPTYSACFKRNVTPSTAAPALLLDTGPLVLDLWSQAVFARPRGRRRRHGQGRHVHPVPHLA